jgi:energy-coupling factor transporter ATP-binding protein EcfA2
MAEATGRVLSHLEEVGFQVRSGEAMPFGEPLPLVSGVAWDTKTAQLALIAEGRAPLAIEAWQQLLFAGAGIRHQLAGDDTSAFGTPVVVAIVDADGAGELRGLAEQLVQDFAVFSRVDLNLVLETELGDSEHLDDALAPLLPRCRRLLGTEISRAEVQKFWQLLQTEVERAAGNLAARFGDQRIRAGSECAEVLIGDSAEAEELPSPNPIAKIGIRHLRSIEAVDLDLAAVSVVHGPNGSGKTTLVEAMELAWAGRSQRIPPEISIEEYAKHLPRGGRGEFAIERDGDGVAAPTEKQRAQLNRCVLTHEAINELVSEHPQQRFSALLEVTGLEIPDLKSRTEALLRDSKAGADQALSAAGMANLPRASSVGLKHLDEELKSELVHDYSALPDLGQIEATLATVAKTFQPRRWAAEERLLDMLEGADRAVAKAIAGEVNEEQLEKILNQAGETVAELLAERSEAAAASRALLEVLREQLQAERAVEAPREEQSNDEEKEAPLAAPLAARWLNHSISIQREAVRFREDAAKLEEAWRQQLRDYAAALERAVEMAPQEELERFSKPAPRPRALPTPKLAEEVLGRAGFSEGELLAEEVGPVLRELSDALDNHVTALRQLGRRLEGHPGRRFGRHAEAVMAALCRYELARTLRREGPILQASERLVCRLLDERLAPVMRELMAAIVRFEWYFKPLQMSSDARRVVLSGLATERDDLDARLLLNSAERTVLGLSWFCALHMLQPPERRKVLVMDDPTAGFDNANTAGFASTLRAFTRLLRPEQVVIATHDEQVAAMLGEELATVDGWPDSVVRIRFSRDAEDCSVASEEWAEDRERQVSRESEQLGLGESLPA